MIKIKQWNGAIDFWKFCFALLIVIFHSKNLAFHSESIFIGGSIGVEFFFIVSGFLMAVSASKNNNLALSVGTNTRKFIFKKIRALIPYIYVAWIIGFIAEHIGKNASFTQIIQHAISSVWELLFIWESGLSGFRANAVTWYISAMLIAMLILYPILKKNRDMFFNVIAPLITLAIFGILYKNSGTLRAPSAWFGFIYKGQLRAIAEISLGCICYAFYLKLSSIQFTQISKIILALLELGGYIFIWVWSYSHGGSKFDFFCVLILAVSITITFSKQSALTSLFDNKFCYWLGKFSLPLFLGHGYWSHALPLIYPNMNYFNLLFIYLGIAFLTSLLIMYTSIWLRRLWPKTIQKFKYTFIYNENI